MLGFSLVQNGKLLKQIVLPSMSRNYVWTTIQDSIMSKRMTINLPDDLANQLAEVAAKEEVTQLEILRKALSYYLFMGRKVADGYQIRLIHSSVKVPPADHVDMPF